MGFGSGGSGFNPFVLIFALFAVALFIGLGWIYGAIFMIVTDKKNDVATLTSPRAPPSPPPPPLGGAAGRRRLLSVDEQYSAPIHRSPTDVADVEIAKVTQIERKMAIARSLRARSTTATASELAWMRDEEHEGRDEDHAKTMQLMHGAIAQEAIAKAARVAVGSVGISP